MHFNLLAANLISRYLQIQTKVAKLAKNFEMFSWYLIEKHLLCLIWFLYIATSKHFYLFSIRSQKRVVNKFPSRPQFKFPRSLATRCLSKTVKMFLSKGRSNLFLERSIRRSVDMEEEVMAEAQEVVTGMGEVVLEVDIMANIIITNNNIIWQLVMCKDKVWEDSSNLSCNFLVSSLLKVEDEDLETLAFVSHTIEIMLT